MHSTLARPTTAAAMFAILVVGSLASRASAAEITLRSELRTEGGLVLLGDIAEVTSGNPDEAKQLATLDIMAAPAAGQRRYLRARELQDLLTERGVNWRDHRLSGASQVAIIGALDKPTITKPKASAAMQGPSVSQREATARAQAALLDYIEECTDRAAAWQVKFELTNEQAQFVGKAGEQLVVSGGEPPWTGQQQFHLTATLDGQTRQTSVRVEVTLPPMLVVASHPLPRGAIVRADDVRLQPGIASKGESHAYQSLEEVVGKEIHRAVAEGQILDDQSVRAPLLVKRGDIVTVYARSGGVQVRTTARAREDGSHNDLVSVESLADRSAYFTRVIGVQEVEVYAHAVSVPGEIEPPRDTRKVAQRAAPEPPLPGPMPNMQLAREKSHRAESPASRARQASAKAPVAAVPLASQPAPGSVLAKAAFANASRPVTSVVAPHREEKKKSDAASESNSADN